MLSSMKKPPVPEFEWDQLTEVLGLDLLSRLLDIPSGSIRRYKASARITPDEVGAKLHLLRMVAGDLGGAYNEIGIRQWFDRRRAQLGGRAPSELLKGRWTPGEPGPRQVRDLARSSISAPAT
jgi:hypothetical protein